MTKGFIVALVAVVLVSTLAQAFNGVDVSSPIMPAQFSCLNDNGYHFAVIRVYQSNGQVDPNGVHTIYKFVRISALLAALLLLN